MSGDKIYYVVVDEGYEQPTIKVVSNPSDDALRSPTRGEAIQVRAKEVTQRKRCFQKEINRIDAYLRKLSDLWVNSLEDE